MTTLPVYVLGPEGAGKSTLCLQLRMLLEERAMAWPPGRVLRPAPTAGQELYTISLAAGPLVPDGSALNLFGVTPGEDEVMRAAAAAEDAGRHKIPPPQRAAGAGAVTSPADFSPREADGAPIMRRAHRDKAEMTEMSPKDLGRGDDEEAYRSLAAVADGTGDELTPRDRTTATAATQRVTGRVHAHARVPGTRRHEPFSSLPTSPERMPPTPSSEAENKAMDGGCDPVCGIATAAAAVLLCRAVIDDILAPQEEKEEGAATAPTGTTYMYSTHGIPLPVGLCCSARVAAGEGGTEIENTQTRHHPQRATPATARGESTGNPSRKYETLADMIRGSSQSTSFSTTQMRTGRAEGGKGGGDLVTRKEISQQKRGGQGDTSNKTASALVSSNDGDDAMFSLATVSRGAPTDCSCVVVTRGPTLRLQYLLHREHTHKATTTTTPAGSGATAATKNTSMSAVLAPFSASTVELQEVGGKLFAIWAKFLANGSSLRNVVGHRFLLPSAAAARLCAAPSGLETRALVSNGMLDCRHTIPATMTAAVAKAASSLAAGHSPVASLIFVVDAMAPAQCVAAAVELCHLRERFFPPGESVGRWCVVVNKASLYLRARGVPLTTGAIRRLQAQYREALFLDGDISDDDRAAEGCGAERTRADNVPVFVVDTWSGLGMGDVAHWLQCQ